MIKTKKELSFYLMADRMMNRGQFKRSIQSFFKDLLFPDYIMRWMRAMRYTSFYGQHKERIRFQFRYLYWFRRFKYLSMRLGFSIGPDVFGYGLVIPHYGTIVVGGGNSIGNYAVLHTSTCIVDSASIIGDGFYLSTGAIVSHHVELGDGVSLGVNSTLIKGCGESGVLMVGTPAIIKKESVMWWLRDGDRFQKRVAAIEKLKRTY